MTYAPATDGLFIIQAGAPNVAEGRCREADDLAAAIEGAFTLWSEDVIINWNRTYIPMSYKYDLSVVAEQVVELLVDVLSRPAGEREVDLTSDTFFARWDVSWTEDMLGVKAAWRHVGGDLESVQSRCSTLRVRRLDFLGEWKAVFGNVIAAIRPCTRLQDARAYLAMRGVYENIPNTGALYREGTPLFAKEITPGGGPNIHLPIPDAFVP